MASGMPANMAGPVVKAAQGKEPVVGAARQGKAFASAVAETLARQEGRARGEALAQDDAGAQEHEVAGETGAEKPMRAAAAGAEMGGLLALLGAHVAARDAGEPAASREGGRKTGPDERAGRRIIAAEQDAETDGRGRAEAEEPAAGPDRLFRFARADGRGRALELRIEGDSGRVMAKDAPPAGGGAGEAVTVLDARRYPGLAPGGNPAAVTAAIAGEREWAASLRATGELGGAEAATGGVVNTLKIRMNPVELGLVTATLRLKGEELVVTLQVETGEAYRQLGDDSDAIVKALRGQGFAVDQVSVQLSPAERSAATPHSASGEQQAREGRGGEREGGGNGNGKEKHSAHDGTADNAGGGQPLRSDGVYL